MSSITLRQRAKRILRAFGFDHVAFIERLAYWSVNQAIRQNGLANMIGQLREIVPDIKDQESRSASDSPLIEIRRRALHAVQCRMMMEALGGAQAAAVVDIGDSAGTHMLYLRSLLQEKAKIETISVNLDSRAIAKIRSRGLRAIQMRAEEIGSEHIGNDTSLLTSFEMVEHLHNPAIFFRRLAIASPCNKMVISVPFLRQSRVGLHHIRAGRTERQFAEDVHVFELSPEDWSLLMLHAGWRVTASRVHFQYPTNWLLISSALSLFWRLTDFEGFWCAILERDVTTSNLYADWED